MFSQMIFSERVCTLRKEHNLKQEELGAIVGLKKSAISMIEKGQRAASIEVIYAIAEHFSVSLDWLTGLSESRERLP